VLASALLASCSPAASGSTVVVRNSHDRDVVAQIAIGDRVETRLIPAHMAMAALATPATDTGSVALMLAPDCVSLADVPVAAGVSAIDVTGSAEVLVSEGDIEELSDLVLAPPTLLCQ
jgi:hypothetical protein